VNVGLSVSRVAHPRKTKAMKKVAGKIKGELAQYREMALSRSSVPISMRRRSALLARGSRLTELLKQRSSRP